MASRWLGLVGLTVVAGLGLQACVAVPVREHRYGYRSYAYGGSGYSDVNPNVARDECYRVARDYRRYRDVSVGAVDITGPETAQVELRVHRPFGGREVLGCTYDARTGRAFVP